MKWLILLALIPLSRILFNIALWFGHRKKNMEDDYGINIAKRMLVRLGLHDKVNIMLEGNDDCYDPSKNIISFLLSMAALTYFVDIINCIYMVGRLLLKMSYNERKEER